MRLSEAILLGDVLKSGNPDKWISKDGSCGCAFGGALLAVGVKPQEFAAEFPPITGMDYRDTCKVFSEMRLVRKQWYWITAENVEAISDLYHKVYKGKLTIQDVADYVRSLEPAEQSESVSTSNEITFTDKTSA